MASILEQYRISDFLEWFKEKKLRLDPEFQRGSVWTPGARTYLIDTILNDLPIPKIYLRTTVDIATKKSTRDVVDGQQRLRAIIDFANDKFALSNRSEKFSKLRYSTLDTELQQAFLSYPIAVGQLLNADNEDVLEVFARLNSYSVRLNNAEKRHAKFQGDFKWAVRQASRKWSALWNEFGIITTRQRVRMLDDSLMAEMFGIMIEGVRDGGQPKIDKLYRSQDNSFDSNGPIIKHVNNTVSYFIKYLATGLENTPILSAPHFLMLFSALAHARHGIPLGDLGAVGDPDAVELPDRGKGVLTDLETTSNNLLILASVIDSDDPPPGYEDFWKASKSSTQRIASRKIRFPVFYRALLPAVL